MTPTRDYRTMEPEEFANRDVLFDIVKHSGSTGFNGVWEKLRSLWGRDFKVKRERFLAALKKMATIPDDAPPPEIMA